MSLEQFLRDRGIEEEVIQRMQDDKVELRLWPYYRIVGDKTPPPSISFVTSELITLEESSL